VARLSRHELKQDEFISTVEAFEQFARQNYAQILAGVAAAIIIAGSILGWKSYNERQEAAANTALAAALTTFNAKVAVTANLFSAAPADTSQFTSSQQKYKKALTQFSEVVAKYPRQPAADFARYHIALCQAALGQGPAALKTLEAASHVSDKDAAALAQMALAGELAETGNTAGAIPIYQSLANHPTSTVPRATALLALADLYRNSQPAQARALYEQVEKEFGTDSYLASTVKQQLASLPK
jgi:predicted negative regulator of RcsB-dependent stress response